MLGDAALENTRKNTWPGKRKWNVEVLHQSRVEGTVQRTRKGRVRLLQHVGIMSEERTLKNVFQTIPEGKRPVGKPRERGRRLDGVENDQKIMGVRGWRKRARDIDAWKMILNVARVVHGP
jgi:hypothetical protein